MTQSKYKWLYVMMTIALVVGLFFQLHMVGYCAESGTLQITLSTADGSRKLQGAEIVLYRVADVEKTAGGIVYHLTKEYQKSSVKETDLEKVESIQQLLQYISEQKLSGIKSVTDSEGYIEFPDLSYGLYLMAQTNNIDPYSRITPCFISMPTVTNGVENNLIQAAPKVDIPKVMDLTVRKVWNDDGTNRPGEIKVGLFQSGIQVDTEILSAKNNWSYTWYSIAKAYDWSVVELEVPAGYKATYKREGEKYIIENTPILIQTGQMKWPIPILFIAGAFLIVIGLQLRRDSDEK